MTRPCGSCFSQEECKKNACCWSNNSCKPCTTKGAPPPSGDCKDLSQGYCSMRYDCSWVDGECKSNLTKDKKRKK